MQYVHIKNINSNLREIRVIVVVVVVVVGQAYKPITTVAAAAAAFLCLQYVYCVYVYLLRSIFDMLIVLPVFRHCRHHPRDVINFRMLPLFVDTSLPRSISDERHDDESSKLEPRR